MSNKQFAETCKFAKEVSDNVAERCSNSICKVRFPLVPFYSLFKNLLLNSPLKQGEFVEINMETILGLISEYDLEGTQNELKVLKEYIVERCPRSVGFLKHAINLFSSHTEITNYLGEIVLAILTSFELPNKDLDEFYYIYP